MKLAHGQQQYLNGLWLSSSDTKVCQENIPHNITPLPTEWNVDRRIHGIMLLVPNSNPIICVPQQSSTVQFWWVCEHCSLSSLFLAAEIDSGTWLKVQRVLNYEMLFCSHNCTFLSAHIILSACRAAHWMFFFFFHYCTIVTNL